MARMCLHIPLGAIGRSSEVALIYSMDWIRAVVISRSKCQKGGLILPDLFLGVKQYCWCKWKVLIW